VEPLRIAENNIADLNDYETEVDDIIFHLEIDTISKKYYPKQLSKMIKEVLNQALICI
jgi:hypothetical protein